MKRLAYYRATRTGFFRTASGASLRYSRFGQGPEPVVVIPGIDDAVQNLHAVPWFWAWYFRPLAERGRSVFLISRARGLPATLSIADLAEIYGEVIEQHVGSTNLLGISMGGMIAQHVAAHRPHLVKRLILVVTAHRLAQAGHAHGEELMALARAGRWLAFMRLSNELCFSGALRRMVALGLWLATPFSWLLKRRGRRAGLVRAALDFCTSANACAAHDTEKLLSCIQVPTLVWGASDDLLFPTTALEEMAGLLPEARLVTVDGAHAAFLQKRSRFQRSVVDFLGLPAGSAEP